VTSSDPLFHKKIQSLRKIVIGLMLKLGNCILMLRPRLCDTEHCNAIKGGDAALPPESDSDNIL
jgi:hypothetical protein